MTPRQYYLENYKNHKNQFCFLCKKEIKKELRQVLGESYANAYAISCGILTKNLGASHLISFSPANPENIEWNNSKYYRILFHEECFKDFAGEEFDDMDI